MATPVSNKRGLEHLDQYEPKAAKHLRSLHDRMAERRLVVILEGASLETVKVKCCDPHVFTPITASYLKANTCVLLPFVFLQVGKTFELLNCDQHKNMIIKTGRDPGHIRPDITHQVTLSSLSCLQLLLLHASVFK